MSLLRLAEIPSARAEEALDRTNVVLAEFREAWPSGGPRPTLNQNAARDAVFRLVTIAEMFAGERLVEATESQLPDHDIVLRLWDERVPRILRDWPGRQAGWRDVLEVNWSYSQWNELKGFISARNIIAHGMGQLTRSQLRRGRIREGLAKELAAAKVGLNGHELTLTDKDVERCGKRVRHFIEWLDNEVG